jgi:hypothetical protein
VRSSRTELGLARFRRKVHCNGTGKEIDEPVQGMRVGGDMTGNKIGHAPL